VSSREVARAALSRTYSQAVRTCAFMELRLSQSRDHGSLGGVTSITANDSDSRKDEYVSRSRGLAPRERICI
jgi:hypothetical protein